MAIGRSFTEAQKALRSIDKWAGTQFHWDGEAPTSERRALIDRLAQRGASRSSRRSGGGATSRNFSPRRRRPLVPRPDILLDEVATCVSRRPGRRSATASLDRQMLCVAWPETRCAKCAEPRYPPLLTRHRAAELAARTPYHFSTYDCENEVYPREARGRHHPALAPTSHGPGHRVDYCACTPPCLVRSLRDHHGQLQPRDGVDRLRYPTAFY